VSLRETRKQSSHPLPLGSLESQRTRRVT
jgi:hypothetical protein